MVEELWLCSAKESVIERWHEGLKGYSTSHFDSVEAVYAALEKETPNLLLLHLQLPGLDGVQGALILRQRFPDVRLLAFADKPENEEALLLLQNGSHGYFNSYLAPHLLSKSVALVESGDVIVNRELIVDLIARFTSGIVEPSDIENQNIVSDLTGREREIVRGICQGMSNKRIANTLGISERTVKAHLSSIFRKADVHDRLHLAMKMNKICI